MSQSEGDTQPISQRIIEELRSKCNHEYGEKFLPGTCNGACEGTCEGTCETHESSLCTCTKDQPGFVDLVGGFEQPLRNSPEEPFLENNDEMDPLSPVAHVRAELYPESKRFQQPKTPATNGKKFNHNDEAIHQGDTTPRLPLNPFAGQVMGLGSLMDASQAFRATQAVSSPLTNMLQSDAISDRPSPHIYNIQRPATAGPSSSPMRARSFIARSVIEPQTKYISMKESQENREMLARRSLELNVSVVVSSDEDFESDDSQIRRRRNQRKIDLKTKGQLSGVTAPPRQTSNGRGRGKIRGRLGSNECAHRSGREASKAVIISDDIPVGGDTTEEEMEHEEENEKLFQEEIDELADENKENIELPLTISKFNQRECSVPGSQLTPSRPQVNVVSSAEPSEQLLRRCESLESLKKSPRVPEGTQTTAIADSQPSLDSEIVWQQQGKVPDHPAPSPRLEALTPSSQKFPPHNDCQAGLGKDKSAANTTNVAPESQSLQKTLNSSSPIPTSKIKHRLPRDEKSISIATRTTPPNDSNLADISSDRVSNAVATIPYLKDVRDLDKLESSESSNEPIRETERPMEELPRSGSATKNPEPHVEGKLQTDFPGSSPSKPHTVFPEKTTEVADSGGNFDLVRSSVSTHSPQLDAITPSKTLYESSPPQASAASTRFETAQTTVLRSPTKSLSFRRQPLRSALTPGSASPPHKTLAQILADPSPSDVVEQPDVDIDLLTREDMDVLNALDRSSPVVHVRKRRRGNGGQVFQAIPSEPDMISPLIKDRTPRRNQVLETAQRNPATTSHSSKTRIPIGERVLEASRVVPEERTSPITNQIPHWERGPEVFQPKSDITLPRKTDPNIRENNTNQDVLTGDELAVDHSAWMKEKDKPNPKPVGVTSKEMHEKSSTSVGTKPTPNPTARPRKILPLAKPKSKFVPNGNKGNSDMAITRSAVSPLMPCEAVPDREAVPTSEQNFLAPDRVFAHFNGRPPAFYPATCTGVVAGEVPRYEICFDDGTPDVIGGFGIGRLELRVGDCVKFEGSRGKIYIVQGFADRQLAATLGPDTPSKRGPPKGKIPPRYTDVFGFATVILAQKQQKSVNDVNAETIQVSFKSIYLTQSMWANFKDRTYNPVLSKPSFRIQTPSDRPSTPYTPSSRGCRTKTSFLANPRSVKVSAAKHGGLFSNTAFAITHVARDEDRERVTNKILSNGGQLFDDGFDELFNIPPLELASKESTTNPHKSVFRLTQAAQSIGFTCLIADGHCRKAKYIQALAIGIPCLATRWVHDCVTKQRLIPWEPYLLPAGDSVFLSGAIHSRIVQPYDPNSACLADVVANRPKILDGDSVLVVMSKSEEETNMKFHPLIMHALGARKVAKVLSLEDASRAIVKPQKDGEEPWNRIYSFDNEIDTEEFLFGVVGTNNRKKRKRGRESCGGGGSGERERGKGGKVRVVGNEFVIQSLILGQAVDALE